MTARLGDGGMTRDLANTQPPAILLSKTPDAAVVFGGILRDREQHRVSDAPADDERYLLPGYSCDTVWMARATWRLLLTDAGYEAMYRDGEDVVLMLGLRCRIDDRLPLGTWELGVA